MSQLVNNQKNPTATSTTKNTQPYLSLPAYLIMPVQRYERRINSLTHSITTHHYSSSLSHSMMPSEIPLPHSTTSWHTFFSSPLFRLPKYELLLQELLKYTFKEHRDYNLLQKALQQIKETTNFVNENKRNAENLSKLLSIQNTIHNCIVRITTTLLISHSFTIISESVCVCVCNCDNVRFALCYRSSQSCVFVCNAESVQCRSCLFTWWDFQSAHWQKVIRTTRFSLQWFITFYSYQEKPQRCCIQVQRKRIASTSDCREISCLGRSHF